MVDLTRDTWPDEGLDSGGEAMKGGIADVSETELRPGEGGRKSSNRHWSEQ